MPPERRLVRPTQDDRGRGGDNRASDADHGRGSLGQLISMTEWCLPPDPAPSTGSYAAASVI